MHAFGGLWVVIRTATSKITSITFTTQVQAHVPPTDLQVEAKWTQLKQQEPSLQQARRGKQAWGLEALNS